MTDFLPSTSFAISISEPRRFPFLNLSRTNAKFHAPFSLLNLSIASHKNGCTQFFRAASMANRSSRLMMGSRNYRFDDELEFEDKGEKILRLERNRVDADPADFEMNLEIQQRASDAATSSESEDFVEGSRKEESSSSSSQEEDLVRMQSDDTEGDDLKKDEEFERFGGKIGVRRRKQVIRRSNLLAKQVISIRSAISLGFVSQLWVDTASWMVLFVEVRPNLLSGESERFLLDDISQVGDVVLVQDESVIENEYRMVGLETLVGYKVVTPSQQNIGKVRGYTFSINSGAVESLELDSFGLSIIPSSLVSTYSLLVEDILEVISDAVVVHEAAASRIQRLSKGLLGNQNMATSVDDVEEYSDYEESATYGYASRTTKNSRRKKTRRRDWDTEDDWELPMDYL